MCVKFLRKSVRETLDVHARSAHVRGTQDVHVRAQSSRREVRKTAVGGMRTATALAPSTSSGDPRTVTPPCSSSSDVRNFCIDEFIVIFHLPEMQDSIMCDMCEA